MKLNWDDFKGQFDESWWKWVQPIITSQKFAEDFANLKKEAKQGKVIPSGSSGNLFRVFREVKYGDLVAVVVGLSPYNVIKNGKEVADGLALSCSNTMEEQPTLKQWYNAMETEFGNIERDPDLSYLTKQGILLYNFSLTTGQGEATNHLYIWEYFTKALFEGAISESGVPIITLGKEAAKVSAWTVPWQVVHELKHPAYASYAKITWNSEGVFKKVKDYLAAKGVYFNWVKQKEKF